MKKLTIFIISILTALSIYSERVLKEMIIIYDKIKIYDLKELIRFSYSNTDFLLILFISTALIFFYHKFSKIKKVKSYNILSLFFSFFLVFGFSYSVLGNSSLVTGSIILIIISLIKFISYYLFLSTLLNLIAIKLKEVDLTKIKIPKIFHKFQEYYDNHPYKTIILILIICWLPYIISFYPSILSPDPSNQIKQYFGIITHYVEGVNLIDSNVLITNHHPVFHTFILGGFAKIGANLGNINFGLFLFTCFQLFVVISALTYSITYLKKLKIPFIYQFIILLIFALVPVFPLYALSCVKDTLFGAILIFYIIEIHKLLTTKNYKFKDYFILTLLLLILMLVRNNGIYIILISFLSLIFVLKDRRKSLILVLLISVFTYEAHNRILLPKMHISMGSIREMLSVPFQQTARYVKYHHEDLTKDEIKVIDKILKYDTLGKRYKPNIADPVKNEFNKDTTTEDLINYFKVWLSCFFKHPGTYFNATINTVYGYFYPNTSNWYVYHEYDTRLIESGINYHYNNLKIPRKVLSSFGIAYPYIPVLGSIVNIGFLIWTYMYLLAFLIHNKQKKLINLILPAFILLLTCIVGPVNTYFRYMFPLLITLPLIIGLIYLEKRKN